MNDGQSTSAHSADGPVQPFDGDGPQLINGTFSCDGCTFHFSTPKENGGSVYQIHFCTLERMMTERMSNRYIGRRDTTPEWCPILEEIED